jgi:DNA-binding response OmpR family regulator
MTMQTILIHGNDRELSGAWASYFSREGYAVFTSADSIEAAEIATMVKIDSVIISTNNPAAYLLFGKVLKMKRSTTKVVAITRMRRSALELLLQTEDFTALESPLTFGALKDIVTGSHQKTEEMRNVFV